MNLTGNLGNLNNGATGAIVRDFITTSSWSVPSGLTCATIIVIGAGGGGGGGAAPNSGVPRFQASGGGGGGGGGISCCNYTCASLSNSPYCIRIGTGGAGGAKAALDSTNGQIGVSGNGSCVTYTGGTLLSAQGGGRGTGGCYCPNQSSCIVVSGGPGGTGSTYTGNGGGRGVYQYNAILTSDSACAGNGGRGGGSGAGYSIAEGIGGAGGAECSYVGLRFGKGGDMLLDNTRPPDGAVYGAGGGGGRASIISGAACPSDGGAGSNGIIRIIEYYN